MNDPPITGNRVVPTHAPLPEPVDVTHIHGQPVAEVATEFKTLVVALTEEVRNSQVRITVIIVSSIVVSVIVATWVNAVGLTLIREAILTR